jgi:hypothetical protein
MDDTQETASPRSVGPLSYLLFLLRGPLLVTLALAALLLDFIIPGSMKEALRYALFDRSLWYQFAVIGAALFLACGAIRFSGEALIELVSPDLNDGSGSVARLARLLPRLMAFSVGLALAWPLFFIVLDTTALRNDADSLRAVSIQGRLFAAHALALGAATAYVLIAFFVAIRAKGPHTIAYTTRDPPLLMRLGLAMLPLLIAAIFAVAVLGVWQPGIGHRPVERYSSALIGAFSNPNDSNTALRRWIYDNRDGAAEQAACDARNAALHNDPASETAPEICVAGLRYQNYTKTREVPRSGNPGVSDIYVEPTVSPLYVMAMLLSLLAACIALRLALAIALDVLFPAMGNGGPLARFFRRWLPPLGSFGLAFATAAQVFWVYLGPQHIAFYKTETLPVLGLTQPEQLWALGIIAVYLVIGILASLGRGSTFSSEGGWRSSRSVGRRMLGAARRLAALEPFWQWLIRGLLLFGLAVFLMFADLSRVEIPQWFGPVGILLLWGAMLAAALFILSYLGHMTRIPILSILVLAGLVFAGFNINDNHEVRTVPKTVAADVAQFDALPQLDLVKWLASREDRAQYEHYPVFLVATEGGGIRAAYFTASILAALQERCPAFAQHTIAISGVSGGSLGASVFAALAADQASAKDFNPTAPGCRIAGGMTRGPVLERAQKVLSADLLSPLLGATLFPDSLQRVIPVPIPAFDRSTALEFAVEKAWRDAIPGCLDGGTCDRFHAPATNLYGGNGRHVVPYLFLNTTEAETGTIIPFATAEIVDTHIRDRSQIDDRNLDCVQDGMIGTSCLKPRQPNLSMAYEFGPDLTLPLSTAAILSARFPYLTPAGSVEGSPNKHVDGGYFENSGTFKLTELVQNLIAQQLCLRENAHCPGVDPNSADAKIAANAVFIVIIIKSEPCTRRILGDICAEDMPTSGGAWSELLSPLRALLSTRDKRAAYSIAGLDATSALIEQMRVTAGKPAAADSGISCDNTICAVTLQFLNKRNTDIPLTWLLSAGARHQMNRAVAGMESADVRFASPPVSMTNLYAPGDRSQVLGSYRRVLCLLAGRKDATSVCTPNAAPK